MLRETGVLATKVYSDWDWRAIEALCDGPLRSTSRLLRLLRSHERWIKRQLSLLRPDKECFSHERRDDPAARTYARVAYKLLDLMLATDESTVFLGQVRRRLTWAGSPGHPHMRPDPHHSLTFPDLPRLPPPIAQHLVYHLAVALQSLLDSLHGGSSTSLGEGRPSQVRPAPTCT